MIKRKHSIAHITLVYLVIASLILAAMIMSFYTAVSIRAADSDSPALINSFVDTYKFMMNKEDETLSHLEKDSDVSEQLIASARRMSGEGFNEVVSGDPQSDGDRDKLIEEGVDYQSALDDLAAAYGCDFLSLEADGRGDYRISAATNGFTAYDRLSELDLVSLADSTKSSGKDIARVSGRTCLVICTKEFDTENEPDDAAMMIVPIRPFVSRAFALTATLLFIALAMCTAVAVWIISVYRRLSGGSFDEEQKDNYSKNRVKSKLLLAAAVLTIAACLSAAFSMSVDSVFLHTSQGTSSLEALFDRIDGDSERTKVQWESSQARYINNAKTLAALIDSNRSLQNRAWLSEASDIIGADYIMIFDSEGREIISDSDYRGVSLKGRSEPEMADFGRLLNGVESISHAGVHDEITGLTRDYHGICLRYLAGDDSYGAMLIAVDPKKYSLTKFTDVNNVMDSMAPPNCFIMDVEPSTGIISHSSSRALIGTSLSRKDTYDLFLGYLKFRNRPYYAVSSSHGDRLYYYCADKNCMFKDVGPFTLCYTLLFLVLFVIMCRMLLRWYPDGPEKSAVFSERVTGSISEFFRKAAAMNEKLLSVTEMPRANKEIARVKDWDATPEREAMSILELMLFIFTISVGAVILLRRGAASGGTVLDYILTGNWTHGPNLFSFTAIFFLFCSLFFVLAVLKVVSSVFNAVLSKRVLTICSLLLNMLFYAALAAFLFLSLSFLGVNTKALIASAGFVGLAVSLSLQDILSDIFAGISIIAGRTFEVGDHIEVRDAGTGTVTMIGLRRTELVDDSDMTFSIRNSQIGKVINHSRDNGHSAVAGKADKKEKEGRQKKQND